MGFKHLTEHLLQVILEQDEAPSDHGFEELLRSAVEVCDACRREYERAAATLGFQLPERPAPATIAAVARLLKHGIDLTHLRHEAAEDFEVLVGLSPEERRARVLQSPSRFRSPFLVERLLEQAKAALRGDPHAADGWAVCAHAVALRLAREPAPPPWAPALLCRAAACRGNVLRARGDYRTAEPLLERALAYFEVKGDGDPLVEAELVALLGTLKKDQRQHSPALALLERARAIYEEIEDPVLAAKISLKIASLCADVGEGAPAIHHTRAAMAVFEHHGAQRLYVFAVHYLAHFLRDDGKFEEARDLLAAHAEHYRMLGEPLLNLRLAWLSGTIAQGLGQAREAEATLDAVRARFLAGGLAYDAALAGLDLALVYLDQGRTAEIGLLAQEIVPIFLAQDVEREAMGALLLFQQAVGEETLTSSLVRDLSRHLRCQRR